MKTIIFSLTIVNLLNAAPFQLPFQAGGPVERKCREISWTDLNGQVTQHMDCGLRFSYTINTGARMEILVKDQGLETTSTTTTAATPLPTTTTTAIITKTTT